jgi:hypothetical protein
MDSARERTRAKTYNMIGGREALLPLGFRGDSLPALPIQTRHRPERVNSPLARNERAADGHAT